MRRHGIVSSPGELGLSDHLCWAYSADSDFVAAAVAFLGDGRRLGQRLLYVNRTSRDAMLADLAGLDGRDELLASGALELMPVADRYAPEARFVPEEQVAAYREATDRALADGFTGLRVAAEATALVSGHDARRTFLRYEHLVDRMMAAGHPFAALCAYNRRELGEEAVADLLCVHALARHPDCTVPFQLVGDRDDLVLRGEIDAFVARRLERLLAQVADERARVIDLRHVGFIDHHGVRAIAGYARATEDAGPLTLRGASPTTRRVWELLDPAPGAEIAWA